MLHRCRVEVYVNTPLLTDWLACDKGPADLFAAVHLYRKWRNRIEARLTAGGLMKGSGVRLRLAEPYIKGSEPVVLAEWHKGVKGQVYNGGPTPGVSKKRTPGKRATAAAAPGKVVAAATTLDTQKGSARQSASHVGASHSPKT